MRQRNDYVTSPMLHLIRHLAIVLALSASRIALTDSQRRRQATPSITGLVPLWLMNRAIYLTRKRVVEQRVSQPCSRTWPVGVGFAFSYFFFTENIVRRSSLFLSPLPPLLSFIAFNSFFENSTESWISPPTIAHHSWCPAAPTVSAGTREKSPQPFHPVRSATSLRGSP